MASFSGIKNTLLAEQADKEAAPAHDPNLKSSKAPERYAPGPCCHFLWKKIMLSGAPRRLLFSLCGDYDEAHRCLLSIVMGHSTKCSAYVADICGLFALRLIFRSVFAQDMIHHPISLSGCSDLIGKSCSIPDKVGFIWAALIDSKNLLDFLRQFTILYVPLRLGQRSDSFCHRLFIRPGLKGVILGLSGCN